MINQTLLQWEEHGLNYRFAGTRLTWNYLNLKVVINFELFKLTGQASRKLMT